MCPSMLPPPPPKDYIFWNLHLTNDRLHLSCRELLKHLGFSDMLPALPPASEPSAEESLASAQDTLGQLAVTSPTGQPGTPPAPVASAPSGEDFFSALGGAGKLAAGEPFARYCGDGTCRGTLPSVSVYCCQ